jgi:hypothetical protein
MAKEVIDDHFHQILQQIRGIINTIDELIENPVFIDNITGEQDLHLDRAIELFEAMEEQFEPDPGPAPFEPRMADDSFDAD